MQYWTLHFLSNLGLHLHIMWFFHFEQINFLHLLSNTGSHLHNLSKGFSLQKYPKLFDIPLQLSLHIGSFLQKEQTNFLQDSLWVVQLQIGCLPFESLHIFFLQLKFPLDLHWQDGSFGKFLQNWEHILLFKFLHGGVQCLFPDFIHLQYFEFLYILQKKHFLSNGLVHWSYLFMQFLLLGFKLHLQSRSFLLHLQEILSWGFLKQ